MKRRSGSGSGGDPDKASEEWDERPEWVRRAARRVALRRGAFLTVVIALIVLIAITLVFVGNDNSSSRVSAATTGPTTPRTAGFAAGLPSAITATSFSNPEAAPSSTSGASGGG